MSLNKTLKEVVIGSRGSKLALWQANWVKGQLAARGVASRLEIIKTTGDKLLDVPLTGAGTKGIFIKEIEEALLDGRIDLAVHSLKDLPVDLPQGLTIAAIPEREDPRDAYVAGNGLPFEKLPAGPRLATSGPRRQSQILALRPDLQIVPVRGNVDTRLKKLERGEFDGLLLAAAGLVRLGLEGQITSRFAPDEICPAVGQGALAVETRKDKAQLLNLVRALNHEPTAIAIHAERTVLRCLGGGCQLPLGAYARIESGKLHLMGVVAATNGSRIFRAQAAGPIEEPEALGSRVAEDLIRQGAKELLK